MKLHSRTLLIPAALLAATLAGCVVAPVGVRPVYHAPAGVVYVEPAYAVPAPGYRWAYHGYYGWGWHHYRYGWHRGWR
jgi:hypothetical protein